MNETELPFCTMRKCDKCSLCPKMAPLEVYILSWLSLVLRLGYVSLLWSLFAGYL